MNYFLKLIDKGEEIKKFYVFEEQTNECCGVLKSFFPEWATFFLYKEGMKFSKSEVAFKTKLKVGDEVIFTSLSKSQSRPETRRSKIIQPVVGIISGTATEGSNNKLIITNVKRAISELEFGLDINDPTTYTNECDIQTTRVHLTLISPNVERVLVYIKEEHKAWEKVRIKRKSPKQKLKSPPGSYTRETNFKRASECKNYTEFLKKYPGEVGHARHKGWLEEIKQKNGWKNRPQVTEEEIRTHVADCTTFKEFVTKYPRTYSRIRQITINREGYYAEVTKNLVPDNHKGKTLAEAYGEENARKKRKNMSEAQKKRPPITDEARAKHSRSYEEKQGKEKAILRKEKLSKARKGKSWEELLGKEKAKEIIAKLKKANKGTLEERHGKKKAKAIRKKMQIARHKNLKRK